MDRTIMYVVIHAPDYDECYVDGVFSTRALADGFISAEMKRHGNKPTDYEVEELPLDRTSAEVEQADQAQREKIEAELTRDAPYAYIRDARLRPYDVGNIRCVPGQIVPPKQSSLIQFHNPFVESGKWPVAYELIQEAAKTWDELVKHGVAPQRAMDAIKTIIYRLRGQGTGKSTALRWLVESVSKGEHKYTGDQLGPDMFIHQYEHTKWNSMVDQAVVLRRKGPGYSEPDSPR